MLPLTKDDGVWVKVVEMRWWVDFRYVVEEKLMETVDGHAVGDERARGSRWLLRFCSGAAGQVRNPGRGRGWGWEIASWILVMLRLTYLVMNGLKPSSHTLYHQTKGCEIPHMAFLSDSLLGRNKEEDN